MQFTLWSNLRLAIFAPAINPDIEQFFILFFASHKCHCKMLLSLMLVFNAPEISRAIEGVIWNKRDENFIPIFGVSSFLNEKIEQARIIRDLEHHNFHRARVTVAYYQEKNLVSFNDNDTEITGVCGDLWTLLSDYLNFTLVPVRLEDRRFGTELKNGSFDGLLGLIEQNKALVIPRSGLFIKRLSLLEYTQPLWTIRYYLYIKPEWKHDESWMFHLFTTKLWYSIFLSFSVLCIVGYLHEKYVNRKETRVKHGSNFQDHLLYTVALASTQGCLPAEYHYRSKIVYITTSLFSWLILIAFSSNAIFLMMNKKYILPFTGLGSLIQKSKYEVTAITGSMVHEAFDALVSRYFRRASDRTRVSYTSSTYELYQKVCFTQKKKFAAFESEDLHKANGKYFCRLVHTQHPYFETWIASAVKRGFRYKRSFDNGILKLSETGLLDGLKDRWMNWKLTESEEVPFQSIDISQVYMIFAILFVGLTLSILLLLIEYVIFFRYKICGMCMKKYPFKTEVRKDKKKKITFMLK